MPLTSSSSATQATLTRAIEQAEAKHRGGWLDEVEKIYTEILKVAPGEVDALHLLGVLYRQYGRSEDALRLIERALAILPDDSTLLHARVEIRDELKSTRRIFTKPVWRGDGDLSGKTILLHAGHDFGDTVQFMRYAGVIAHQGARVVLEVQAPLKRLAISSFPDMNVLACGETLPTFDLHAPFVTLPHVYGTTLDTISWTGPYLEPAVELIATWARELPSPKKLRVGVVWAGKATQSDGGVCSLALSSLHDMISLPQIAFISLQHDLNDGDADILARHPNVTRLARGFADFADTAAVISQLDCIVALDTAVAHLAAAMGKSVLLLLPYGSDWHWVVRGRTDSPWYPTVQSYRQHVPGDWSAPLEAARQELIRRAP